MEQVSRIIFFKNCKCGNKIVVTGTKVSEIESNITTNVDGQYTASFIGTSTLCCVTCGRRYRMGNRHDWHEKILTWENLKEELFGDNKKWSEATDKELYEIAKTWAKKFSTKFLRSAQEQYSIKQSESFKLGNTALFHSFENRWQCATWAIDIREFGEV